MIGRVRDRATFEALRRRGRRVRRGPVTVVFLADDAAPPRAAFAVSRKVGNAVVRNRVRRRLRSILGDIERDRARTSGLAGGAYLISVRPEAAELPFDRLADHVETACQAVRSSADRAAR